MCQTDKGVISGDCTAELSSSLGPARRSSQHLWLSQDRGCRGHQKSPRTHQNSQGKGWVRGLPAKSGAGRGKHRREVGTWGWGLQTWLSPSSATNLLCDLGRMLREKLNISKDFCSSDVSHLASFGVCLSDPCSTGSEHRIPKAPAF